MARVVARGDRVPCGCFGASTTPIGRAHIWRNGLLAAAAATGLVAGATSPAVPLDVPVVLVLSLFAAAVVVLLVLSDQLLAVPEPPPRPGSRPHRPPVDSPSTGATRKR
jgi:hypothetical protein